MLILNRTQVIGEAGTLIIKAHDAQNTFNIFKKGETLVYSLPSCGWFSARINCVSDIKQENALLLTVSDRKALSLDDSLLTALMSNQPFLMVEDSALERLTGFSDSIHGPRETLTVRVKKGQYLRLTRLDPLQNTLEERYISWNDWESTERELVQGVTEVNRAFKHQDHREVKEAQSYLGERICRLFRTMDLNFNFTMRANLLDVFWQDNSLLLPLECAFQDTLIVNRLVSRHSRPMMERNNTVFLYSGQLEATNLEVAELAGLLPPHWTYLTIAEEHSGSYLLELQSAGIIHFAGHGKCTDNQGSIIINGVPQTLWPSAAGARGLFLNCCSAGLYPNGIIGSLIEQGVSWAIASPFEIRDKQNSLSWKAARDFYRSVSVSKPLTAYLATGISNPGYFESFRYFEGFRN